MRGIKKQRLFSIITAFCMVFTMMLSGMMGTVKASTTVIPTSWTDSVNGSTGDWTLNDGDTLDLSSLSTNAGGKTITLSSGSATINGGTNKTFTNLAIVIRGGANLTIGNLKIDNSSWSTGTKNPIAAIDNNSGNTLTLNGINAVNAFDYYSAIKVSAGSSLTISSNADGKLSANGGREGAAIGGNSVVKGNNSAGTITITGGMVTANGGYCASSIGGGNEGTGGTINIIGGDVIANGGDYASSIGGGNKGAGGTITISGGIISTTGNDGAAIGGGYAGTGGTINISGGTVTAVETATGSYAGAAIGGGYNGAAGNISISGGTVTATGANNSAGIGTGKNATEGTINITGNSKVTAIGGSGSAGIGSTETSNVLLKIANEGANTPIVKAYGCGMNAIEAKENQDSSVYLVCCKLDTCISTNNNVGVNLINIASPSEVISLNLPVSCDSFATTVKGNSSYNVTTNENPPRKICKIADNSEIYTSQLNDLTFIDSKFASNTPPIAIDVKITGTPQVGQTLTGHYTYNDADGDAIGNSTYKWYRADDVNGTNKTAIAGATSDTYIVTSDDEGKYVSFEVTPVAVSGTTQGTAVSSAYIAIPANAAPIATDIHVDGTTKLGDTLKGYYTYKDTEGDTEGNTRYKWYRSDDETGANITAIAGATSDTYVITREDQGKCLWFAVTPIAITGTITGNEARIGIPVLPNQAPMASNVNITGILKVRQLLTGNYKFDDIDNDLEGTSLYKWYRSDDVNGTNKIEIAGATNKTYTLADADIGKYISFKVTPIAQTGTQTGTAIESAYAGTIADVSHRVTFDSQGGSDVTPADVVNNTTATAPTAPTKTGCTFGGWYKEAGCLNVWDFSIDKVLEDITLYAKWNINNYAVSFDSQGGSDVTVEHAVYNTTAVAPTAPTRTGYTFGGWYKEAGCQNAWNFATEKITSDTTLYAKWNINNYAVSFDSQGGSDVTVEHAVYNTTAVVPTAPIRTGYTFGGWYKEAGCQNAWNSATEKITSDTTLYAKWNVVPMTQVTPEAQVTPTQDKGVDVIINGKVQTLATAETNTVEGKKVTVVTVNDSMVEEKLQSEGNNALVVIPAPASAASSDVITGTLNAQTVKNMESKEAVLAVKTGDITYTIPSAQINVDSVSKQIGNSVELKDIKVNVTIAKASNDTEKVVEDTASKNGYQVVAKPVDFDITATNGDKTVYVSKFNAYVERMVAIPDGVDPSKITTGIVLNSDGTFSHVPTTIVNIDGKYYAKINSLTNSTYSVIYNKKTFGDVENHWAKTSIDDMASRLVIAGTGDNKFEPNRNITRAEFASIIVKGLGLMRSGTGKDSYSDVSKSDWYYAAVSIANDYGLINGTGKGTFDPNREITREEAMAIITRAMSITKLGNTLTDAEVNTALEGFKDNSNISDWAKISVAKCTKNGVIVGNNGNVLAKQNITRAEVAAVVERLLEKSNLINITSK